MSYSDVPIGDEAPEIINAIIEIPKGSHSKYEYDEKLDVIRLDRILHTSVIYPTDYGFIPETRSEDGDHLDVLVFISEPLFPGCQVVVRPIGALFMEDMGSNDAKIIAVAVKDPLLSKIETIDDVDEHYKKEIRHFFEIYKQLENKVVKVQHWHNKEEAYKIIKEAKDRYMKEISHKKKD